MSMNECLEKLNRINDTLERLCPVKDGEAKMFESKLGICSTSLFGKIVTGEVNKYDGSVMLTSIRASNGMEDIEILRHTFVKQCAEEMTQIFRDEIDKFMEEQEVDCV